MGKLTGNALAVDVVVMFSRRLQTGGRLVDGSSGDAVRGIGGRLGFLDQPSGIFKSDDGLKSRG